MGNTPKIVKKPSPKRKKVVEKPEKKPWAFMNCRCGADIPCFSDTPFAICRKCGAVFAQKASKPGKVKEGQPEGFAGNKFLVDLNKGGNREDIPTWIQCWNNDCDKQMIVCGFPWYVCKNDHVINVLTGEKWNWIPSDKLYHELLAIQNEVEKLYQKMFHPQSKMRENTESEQLSSHLDRIGQIIYKQLQPLEPDPYGWGQNELASFGGLRFSANLMHQAVKAGCRIVLPNANVAKPQGDFRAGKSKREGYTDEKLDTAWRKLGCQAVYEYDANEYRENLGDKMKNLLLKINDDVPRLKTEGQAKLKVEDQPTSKAQNVRKMSPSSGDPLPLAIRLKIEMEWTQHIFDDEPVLRVKKTEENKKILKTFILKTLKNSKLFDRQNEIADRILEWSWQLRDPVEEAEARLKHEIGVAKDPLNKKPAQEILRLMRLCHPNEHGEVYGRFDIMNEIDRRGKQMLIDLGWPSKPESIYYHGYDGGKATLQQLCEDDKWKPLSRASHDQAAKLSEATNNEYDHQTLGLSCSTLDFWKKLIAKYPEAKSILKEAIRLDKAFYEYTIHKGALLSSLTTESKGGGPCEHNLVNIAKWLGIDVTRLEPLNSIPKTDIYAGVWHIIENYQPQPLSQPQRIANVKQQARPNKPAQAALTDFFS